MMSLKLPGGLWQAETETPHKVGYLSIQAFLAALKEGAIQWAGSEWKIKINGRHIPQSKSGHSDIEEGLK